MWAARPLLTPLTRRASAAAVTSAPTPAIPTITAAEGASTGVPPPGALVWPGTTAAAVPGSGSVVGAATGCCDGPRHGGSPRRGLSTAGGAAPAAAADGTATGAASYKADQTGGGGGGGGSSHGHGGGGGIGGGSRRHRQPPRVTSARLHTAMQRRLRQGLEYDPWDERAAATAAAAAARSGGWRLVSAAVCERYPIVMPPPSAVEEKWWARAEERAAEVPGGAGRPMPDSFFVTDREQVTGVRPKTQDEVLAEAFTPAPLTTPADEAGDTKSLERALPKRLYLVVRRTPGGGWAFPQRLTGESETMRQSAEKALRAVIGPAPSIHFFGNAPCSHLAHVYPPAYQDKHDVYGVKIFFYRSQLVYSTPPTGSMPIRQAADHAWLTDAELPAYVSAEYHKAVSPFLFGP